MPIGSSDKSVFGVPEQSGQAPSPADLARQSAQAALPSDAAIGSGGGRRRRGKRVAAGDEGVRKRDGSRDAARETAVASTRLSSDLLRDDRARRRRKTAVVSALLAAIFLVSLFVDAGYARFFSPLEVFTCYGIWLSQALLSITSPSEVLSANAILADHVEYFRILNRVGITAMTAMSGAILAIAGALYQSAFRNPIAGPSMLGVSSAIQLGDAILVLVFGVSAGLMLGYRYLICYLCVIVVMVVLFVCTKLMTGRGRSFNVINLLLVAMILNQLIGVVVTYITLYVFSFEQWEAFNAVSEAIGLTYGVLSWVVFLASCVAGIVPVFLLRFRLNGLNFSEAEMRLLGVNATRLRIIALVCGTVLLMAAQVQMGTVAMVSLVVPHISRMAFGAEFRKQLSASMLIGAALLLLCQVIVGFVPYIGNFLPVSVVVNFVVLPFFVWMLATQQRGWEQ